MSEYPDRQELQRTHGAASPPARVESVAAPAYPAYPAGLDDVDDGDDHLPFYRYWLLLRRHKGIVLLAAVLGALLGFLASLPQTPVYGATATVEIQTLNEGFLGIQDVSPTEQARGWGGPDLATQIEIIQSRAVISKARETVEKEAAGGVPASSGRLAAWRRALGFEPESPEGRRNQAIAMAAGSVRASPARDSRIVRISTESTDPKLAASFVNSLANQFIRESIDARWEATQYTEDWLERQLEDLRIKLEDAEDRLQSSAHASGLVFTSETTNVAQEQLQQLQTALSDARADRIAKQSKYELARSSPPEALPDVLDRESLSGYQSELTRLRQQLANLLTTFTDDYPEVKRLRAQIAEIERAMATESQNIIGRIENEYESALRRENLLQADYDKQASLVSEQSRKSIQYNILKREVETTRQLYENLLQKGKEARLAAAMKASPVRVVDEARPSSSPIKPDHSRSSMLGAMFGLALGIAFIVIRDKVDRTIKNPGDTEFYLHAPELGFIPKFGEGQESNRKVKVRLASGSKAEPGGKKRKQPASSEASEPLGVLAKQEGEDERALAALASADLVTWSQSQSWAAECIQATLTSILFSGTNGDVPHELVVTSASPAEGKSTVVGNLAAALAETNQSVLVIDADMRKPRQHRLFELSNRQGLSDLLRHPVPLDEDVVKLVAKQTAVPGVVLLPSGPTTNSVSNLLHSERTRELLRIGRKCFDWVLIDTPPMSQLSDARLLGRLAGAVVLVIKAGSTTRDATAMCEERLRKDGTRLLGTVLNQWQPEKSDPGYYKYKDYYAYRNYYTHADSE